MPQIPGRGSLGNVAPQSTPYNERAMPSTGAAEIGATVANIGGQLLQDQRQRAALADREAKQAAQEAEAARKAADRADALGELHAASDDLAALNQEFSDRIQSGEIDKTKAGEEWATAARDRIGTALQQAPGEHRGTLQRDLDHRLRLGAINVSKAVTRRDQQDVRTGIDQTVEYWSRLYMDNPAQADRTVAETFKALGPHSGLSPEVLAKSEQIYKERSRLAKGAALITAAQHDNATLDMVSKALAGEEFDPLDPQQRTQLHGRIEIFRDRNDRRAQSDRESVDRAAERALKVSESAWNTGTKLAFEGALNAEFAQELHSQMLPMHAKGFSALLETQRQTGAIASRRPTEVKAGVDAVNAQIMRTGITPELKEQRDRLDRVHDGQVSAIRTDGVLRAAGKYGVAEPPPPLDFSRGLIGAVEQLKQRAPAVQQAAGWAEKEEWFYPEEAHKIADQLKALPAKEWAGAVSMLTAAQGPGAARALAEQIDTRDRALALALTSNPTPAGRYRAELIRRGQVGKADGTSTKGAHAFSVPPADWEGKAAAQLAGMFGHARTQTDMVDAATLIMHGISSEGGGRLTEKDIDAAVQMAVGGNIAAARGRSLGLRNGREVRAPLPLPEGVTEDDLDKRLRSIQPSDIWPQVMPKATGGQPVDMSKLSVLAASAQGGYAQVPVADFVKALPGAQLMPARPGQYAVIVNGRPVMSETGNPILIGVR